VKRLAAALHLPAVDPDHHAHGPESGGKPDSGPNQFRF
jgi:hypothetical protein